MKTIFTDRIMIFLMVFSALAGSAFAVEQKTSPAETEFRQLERDIPSLYLINGLFLSGDQAGQLAGLLEKARKIRDQTLVDSERFLQKHQRDLDECVNELIEGAGSSAVGQGRLKSGSRAKRNPKIRRTMREYTELREEKNKEMLELAEQALAILTQAQQDIIGRFVPCFIPPHDFRSPERVGQASDDTSLGEKVLSRLRDIPEDRMEHGREKSLDLLVPYVMKKKHARLTEDEMRRLREELGVSLDQMAARIRTMNDADFELGKSKLVEEVLKLGEQSAGPGKGRDSFQAKPPGGSSDAINKANIYLLNPGNLDILNSRAAGGAKRIKTSSGNQSTPVQLFETGRILRSAHLIADLQLSSEQAKQLLAVVKQAVNERMRIDEEAGQIMEKGFDSYRALKKELADQQPTQKTESEAGRYHHEVSMLYKDRLVKVFRQYEARMDGILSAGQVAYLIAKQGGKSKGSVSDPENTRAIGEVRRRAQTVFDRADRMTSSQFIKSKHELCREFVESCVNDNLIDQDAIDGNKEIARAEQVLERAKTIDRKTYLESKDDLVAEFCPKRNQARPSIFIGQTVMGDPLEILTPTTHLLFNQTALALLEKKAGESGPK